MIIKPNVVFFCAKKITGCLGKRIQKGIEENSGADKTPEFKNKYNPVF
jgi:hypothetical protein